MSYTNPMKPPAPEQERRRHVVFWQDIARKRNQKMTKETAHEQPTAADLVEKGWNALNGEYTNMGEFVDALGRANYAPMLILPALALVSPLSGVPGFTTLCGVMIAGVSLQQIIHRSSIWLPRWIRRARLRTDRVRRAYRWFRIPAKWLDRITQRRLRMLVTEPFLIVPQLLCLICGAVMPLLEVIPFTSSILGVVIVLLAAGMFVGDGLLVLFGMFLATAVAFSFVTLIVP